MREPRPFCSAWRQRQLANEAVKIRIDAQSARQHSAFWILNSLCSDFRSQAFLSTPATISVNSLPRGCYLQIDRKLRGHEALHCDNTELLEGLRTLAQPARSMASTGEAISNRFGETFRPGDTKVPWSTENQRGNIEN